MKKLLLATSALLLSSAVSADQLPNDTWVSFYGNAYWDWTNQTAEFYPGQTLPPLETGPFTSLGSVLNQAYQQMGVDIPLSQIGQGSTLACGTNCFVNVDNGAGVSFSINVLTAGDIFPGLVPANTPDQLFIFGNGIGTLTGYDPTPGIWGLGIGRVIDPNAPTGWWEVAGFVAHDPPSSVPGPIVGAGLPGLIAALALMLGLGRRRKRLSV